MNPKTLKEFKQYLQQELDFGWKEQTEWTKGFDAAIIRYIQKIDEFIGKEAFEYKETCPECEGKGCNECIIILNDEL